ncbi:FkbM family methyltransferase [Phenylobacterium sp.]|uniref:FkbM family methyltransferase n=1 Tax=Phenylobacterium sp. TaxID=1871053 RepID=UPI0035615784
MLDSTVAYGLTFLFPTADSAVGASLRNFGEFARTELDFLLEMATGEGALIDVGANIGAIGLPFARRRPGWKVLAIEAHRGLSAVLAANVLNNRLYNVELFHAAAGAERGLVEFPATPLSEATNFGTIGFNTQDGPMESIRMLTLDEIAPANTRLVKIDVEGFEPQVLQGAAGLIARREAIWLAEATIQNPEASAKVIGAFQAAGYSVHWFYAPFATPVSEKGAPPDAGRGDANVVALPPGAANVWGLPLVGTPDERRPGDVSAYPYLARYGYA